MTGPTDASPDVPTARIEVTGGGVPTHAELAALTVALTPVAGPDVTTGVDAVVGTPAWARAALLEGVGHRTPTRPSDLAAATRLG
ncbi:hypothetical protein [Nitriliruptor alkaliphilus]|uniref:hypothetical protein n=1 Tax=Nitriliruptor alkaliphilus TaxID=427918 RepID=UPI0006965867|nr:hypothetical protein [Nitriliruptor alkaliphilus]